MLSCDYFLFCLVFDLNNDGLLDDCLCIDFSLSGLFSIDFVFLICSRMISYLVFSSLICWIRCLYLSYFFGLYSLKVLLVKMRRKSGSVYFSICLNFMFWSGLSSLGTKVRLGGDDISTTSLEN